MATTMTMSVAPTAFSPFDCCPQCGFKPPFPSHDDGAQASLAAAQNQIAALEAQVRLLNEKASAAVDRWADYEDELAKLRRELNTHSPAPTASTPGPTPLHTPSASVASPARSSFLSSGAASRISALLSPRKSTPNLRASPPQQPPPLPPARYNNSLPLHPSPAIYSPPAAPDTPSGGGAEDLAAALARERELRREAEGRLNETSREVEELSVSLFEQANEMVATERRARVRLEERVETLERREAEKHRRLERLEGAMERIDRVRAVLGQGGQPGAGNRSTL